MNWPEEGGVTNLSSLGSPFGCSSQSPLRSQANRLAQALSAFEDSFTSSTSTGREPIGLLQTPGLWAASRRADLVRALLRSSQALATSQPVLVN